ncbi:MAG: hypothetical protein LBB59_06810 [Campylobacteraceae bacterium]|nr:hypothetical protein [Campylobacteraceae bacterium]
MSDWEYWCRSSDPIFCISVGAAYEEGKYGARQNIDTALHYYQFACDAHHYADGCVAYATTLTVYCYGGIINCTNKSFKQIERYNDKACYLRSFEGCEGKKDFPTIKQEIIKRANLRKNTR